MPASGELGRLLRRDASARDEYAHAKLAAIAAGHDQLLTYSNAKAGVVRALLERA